MSVSVSPSMKIAGRLLSIRYVAVSLVLAFVLATNSPIEPALAQDAENLQIIEQVVLTDESSKNAVLAYRELYERYGGNDADPADTATMLQALSTYEDLQSTVMSYGFSDAREWQATLMSFVMAFTVSEEGNLEELQDSLEEIRESDLPQATKDQLIARFATFIPSQENIDVAVRVSSDPHIAEIIQEIRE